jgi:hypothetical protein
MDVRSSNELNRNMEMTWEEIYSSLPIQSRMIIDIAEAYRIDLTELASLLVQKQENDTNLNEVIYGIS